MPASPSDQPGSSTGIAFLALALGAWLWSAGPAAAQLGPPVRLVPPPPSQTPALAPTPAAPDQTLPPGVQATPLAPVDTAWLGTLSNADNAFPQTLWQGTPRVYVAAALPQLQPTTSPTLQDLTRRLLLSDATAPGGSDPASGRGLVAVRLDRLMALGLEDGALALVDRLQWRGDPEPLDRLKVELHLVNNDTDGACRQVKTAIGHYQDVWWDRAQIACQALAGESGKASLGLSLLRERKVPRDQLFDTLVEAVGGRAVKVDRMPDPTPIRVALLAAAKLPLPADALQAAGPPVLHAWATNAAIPNERRLAAAERAVALGALAPDDLRLLYTEITFKPEEGKNALKQAGESPRARAYLYMTAKQDAAPAARAEALNALLQAAQKRGEFPVTARLVAPLLLAVQPMPDLDWFAPMAARALFAADRPDEARAWIQLADAQTTAQLFTVARLAAGAKGPAWPAEGLGAFLSASQPKEAADPGKIILAATLLGAAGEPVTPAGWGGLLALPPAPPTALPNAALWLTGRDAAANHRLGETVLDTLLMGHAGARLTAEPIVIAEAVARLRAVGLEADARRLAVEAALDAGL